MQKFVSCFCDPKIAEFPIEVELDLEDQRSINIDVARTKSNLLTSEEKYELEKMLTYYCKTKKHSYKQGMNEILVPFLLLSRQNVPKHLIYTCFSNFIEKFLPTLFRDDFFKPLGGLFTITKLILLYHYPEIYRLFEKHQITADMYMTSWFITIFASKIKDLGLLYMFWKTLSAKGEVFFLCYMGVSMLGYFKSLILSHDALTLPLVFKEISINDYDDYQIILTTAESLKESMPYTTEWVLKKYEIFQLDKSDYFSNELEKLHSILILPRGILTQIYPQHQISQSLPSSAAHSKKFLLIDCRPHCETKNGYLLNSELVPKGFQRNLKKLKQYPNKFSTVKFSHHISLMGSSGVQDEESLLMKVFRSFIELDFPHISIVEGGYPACHEFAIEHGLAFNQHKTCLICSQHLKNEKDSKVDNFFKIENLKRLNSLNTGKVFRCKGLEDEDMTTGLSIIEKRIVVIDLRTNSITEDLQVDQIVRIKASKQRSDALSFTFKEQKTRTWVFEGSEVKEFISSIRNTFEEIKRLKDSIRQII